MSRRVRLFAFALAFALMCSTVQALPSAGGPVRPSESDGLAAGIWDWLASLVRKIGSSQEPGHGLEPFWDKEGSHIDPNGNS